MTRDAGKEYTQNSYRYISRWDFKILTLIFIFFFVLFIFSKIFLILILLLRNKKRVSIHKDTKRKENFKMGKC